MHGSKDALGIGISTGGSYTDAVIVNLSTWQILSKAKSHTTYHDLSIGIIESVEKVLSSGKVCKDNIKLISLATTLATNAIIEGKGGKVGLILIGMKLEDLRLAVGRDLPVQRVVSVSGGHGPDGREISALDIAAVEEATEIMKDEVDSFVVSSYFSIRNPAHEQTAKDIIRRHSSKPIICGHELSRELGIGERTITAVLNARVIPIIDRLIRDVKRGLTKMGIAAPLMFVKGDGSLMSEQYALERPVEAIQSGPAASVMGGKFLSGREDAVIVDIGSTTTILCNLEKGSFRIEEQGATIAGWRTRVKAVDSDAIGNGGDSKIWVKEKKLMVGPQRVVPLAFAAKHFPQLKEKISKYHTTEFLSVSRALRRYNESGLPRRIVELISKNEPVARKELEEELRDVFVLDHLLENLREGGYVLEIGLTPTDLMHIKDLFNAGDREAAEVGARIIAETLGITIDELFQRVWDTIAGRIAFKIVERELRKKFPLSKEFSDLIGLLFQGSVGNLRINFSLSVPIVGIGAPAHIFIPDVAKRLHTEFIVPPNHEVGAAIGAITGNLKVSLDYLVEKEFISGEERFVIFPGRHIFQDLESALSYAVELGKKEAAEKLARISGTEKCLDLGSDLEFKIDRKDVVIDGVFWWSEVKVNAILRCKPF
jgi:N-methylhydantoinase A/oxoprolinase/acetone carboxylase beta subunit